MMTYFKLMTGVYRYWLQTFPPESSFPNGCWLRSKSLNSGTLQVSRVVFGIGKVYSATLHLPQQNNFSTGAATLFGFVAHLYEPPSIRELSEFHYDYHQILVNLRDQHCIGCTTMLMRICQLDDSHGT